MDEAKISYICVPKNGEVSEWPNVQAWKVCVPQGTAGSNPAFSADKSNKVPQFCGTFLFSGKSESFFAFKGFQENQKYHSVAEDLI